MSDQARKPTAAELFAVYQAQCDARHDLCSFARYIDIPGVPQDTDDDRRYSVVETELARHHILTLNCLQAMYEGTLAYDPETLEGSISYAQLCGDKPPRGGRFDGGVGDIQMHPPSPNSTKSDPSVQSPTNPGNGVVEPNLSDGVSESTGIYSSPLQQGAQLIDGVKLTSNGFPLQAGVDRGWTKFGDVPEGYRVCRRVMLMMPPGSAKSTYGSVVFPAWVFGRESNFEMILTGWGDPICRRHGKRARQVVASPQYRAVFNEGLDPGTRSAEDWATTNGSSYKSSGIASGVAGFRCGGLGWDDLTKNRKEADSLTIRNDVYNAYIDDARSRKTPDAWEFGIGCLVGDTGVLLADGSEKRIADIEVGDRVATLFGDAEVTNWIEHPCDNVYAIKTSYGEIVRANERHPFLVERDGELEWVRVRNLKPGDSLVANTVDNLEDRTGTQSAKNVTTRLGESPIVTGDRSEGKNVRLMAVPLAPNAKGCVTDTTGKHGEPMGWINVTPKKTVSQSSSTVTASHPTSTSRWSKIRAVSVRFVSKLLKAITRNSTNCISTTTIRQAGFVDFSATSATVRSGCLKRPTEPMCESGSSQTEWATTSILSIEPDGNEPVFDIEVTPHEHFLISSHGVVFASHNTRWHEDEIMGRILPEGYAGESGFMEGRDGNVWFVVCLAAECERDDDPLGREKGEMIWPEWFTEDYWAEKRVIARSWASLYQQRPAPEEGIQFKREWFKRYTAVPENLNHYVAYDPAVSGEDGDDTAIQVWGVDEHLRLYLEVRWLRGATMDVWIDHLITLSRIWKPLEVISEAGVIRRACEPFLKKAMRLAGVFFREEWVTRHANKMAMARGAEAMVASGQVYVPEGPEGDAFIDECLRFPAAKDDHQVDAFVNLCLRLEQIWEANPVVPKTDEKVIIGGSFGGDEMKVKSFMPPKFPKKKSRWRKFG